MQTYFVDAWFFIAQADRSDQDHPAVMRLERLVRGATFVTHDGILGELLTYFSGHGALMRARAAAVARRAMRDISVMPADRLLFLVALDLYERRSDKGYSLVDCMSMVLMRAEEITHVLTNDHHFRQEGFTVVNE